jgi:putative zinc finger/helix-turn-helix YgiT family protein
MRCLQCNSADMKTAQENYLYDASGLPNVTLVGVEVSRCPNCGAHEVEIPRIEELHRVIALAIATHAVHLDGPRIRFLRKWLGWSGVDFGARMGVAPETVSRWETGASAMGTTAERLLRLMVQVGQPVENYSLDVASTATTEEPALLRLGSGPEGWHTEAA